ncbi:dTMP kinase, partial [Vibrio vulnificus]
ERTRQRYLELAKSDASIVTINAEQSIEQVANDIRSALNLWLEQLQD